MKVHLCIIGIFSALTLVKSEPTTELKQIFQECVKELGLSEEPSKMPPNADDPNKQCFVACLLKKNGALVDGKIVAEKAIEIAAKHLSSGGDVDTVKADVTECASKANEEKDECNVAGALGKCIMAKHPK